MTDPAAPSNPPAKARDAEKAKRLASALRENLRRRKAQGREREEPAESADVRQEEAD